MLTEHQYGALTAQPKLVAIQIGPDGVGVDAVSGVGSVIGVAGAITTPSSTTGVPCGSGSESEDGVGRAGIAVGVSISSRHGSVGLFLLS